MERVQKVALDRVGGWQRLLSFAVTRDYLEPRSPRAVGWMEYTMTRPKVDLFLDSGAFSAWTKGMVINIDEYAEFVLANRDAFTVVANLDVIPGKPGEPPTGADIERAAEAGWENWEYLCQKLAPAGIKPLHTYHWREDPKWLRRLIDHSDYLGIGGIALPGMTSAVRQTFLDGIMPLLTDAKGWPIRKFHGFGLTSIPLMLRYPWYSCDSTSWVLASRFGTCYLPLNGKYLKVAFSDQSPKQQDDAGGHYKTFAQAEQAAIRRYVESKGYTVEQLAEDYTKRDELNIIFFLDLERGWIERPWRRDQAQSAFSL